MLTTSFPPGLPGAAADCMKSGRVSDWAHVAPNKISTHKHTTGTRRERNCKLNSFRFKRLIVTSPARHPPTRDKPESPAKGRGPERASSRKRPECDIAARKPACSPSLGTAH